ncbi:hypothetical protein HFP69_36170 [Streptomyces sp. ARC12]
MSVRWIASRASLIVGEIFYPADPELNDHYGLSGPSPAISIFSGDLGWYTVILLPLGSVAFTSRLQESVPVQTPALLLITTVAFFTSHCAILNAIFVSA